jgi:hypothetical protein
MIIFTGREAIYDWYTRVRQRRHIIGARNKRTEKIKQARKSRKSKEGKSG